MLQRCSHVRLFANLSFAKKFYSNFTDKLLCNNKSTEESSDSNSDESNLSKMLSDAATFHDAKEPSEWKSSPYPDTALKVLENENKPPKIKPSETSIVIFPGQGVVKVGDVEQYLKFPRVQQMFAIANEILGYDILKICKNGPQRILNETEFNQPATVLLSLAALEKLIEERPNSVDSCMCAIGYSVGEITALIFSGALTFEAGLQLVSVRANAMQNASELVPQGMLSSFCTATAKVGKICHQAQNWALDIGAKDPLCQVAIYLYTQYKVFGGCVEALEYIQKNSKDLGLTRVKRLPVSGAFHTNLMQPALKQYVAALKKTELSEPNVKVYSNYTSDPYALGNVKFNRKCLIKQLTNPVKWEQILHKVYSRKPGESFPNSFDLGSRGTMKQILKLVNVKASHACYVY